MSIQVSITGSEAVIARLRAIIQANPDAMAQALYDEAHDIRTDSMEHTPVDTGALKASHTVSVPKVTERDVSVTIAVGGPAAPYAVYVHENLEAHHPTGEAKFLEHALMRAIPSMAARLAKRLKDGWGL